MKKNPFVSQAIYSLRSLSVLAIVLGCLWIIVSVLGLRVDATQEKFFTLSEGSKNLIEKLPSDLTIKFYFTKSARNIPVPIKAYASRVEDLLKQYVTVSRGKMTLEVLDPRPDTDADHWARRYGLKAVPLGDGTDMFFGIAVFAGKKEANIAYVDPRREQFLEYDISEALQKLISKDRPKVGILSSLKLIAKNPVQDMQSLMQGKGDWVVISELRKVADVEEIDENTKGIPEKVRILIVHHPKNLGEDTLRAIDQFVLKGGKLIALVDPFSRFDLDQQFQSGAQVGTTSSDLRTLFNAWDIEYDSSKLLGDLKYPTQINAGGQSIIYPFFIQVGEKGFASSSAVTNRLRQMLMAEPGFVRLRSGSPHKFEELISTSSSAGTISAETARMGPDAAKRSLTNESKDFVIAALVRGKFKSAFSAPAGTASWVSQAKDENTIMVVADADFLADQYSVQKFPFSNQLVIKPVNDNLNFLINAIDLLGGSEDLIAIRSRNRFSRPFDRLVEIQEKAQAKWKSEEDSLQNRLAQTQAKLNEMQGARVEGNKIVLTPEQQAEIERFRAEEVQMRTRLREVRKNLREDIESLGRMLSLLNLAVVPFGISVVGGLVFRQRARRKNATKN